MRCRLRRLVPVVLFFLAVVPAASAWTWPVHGAVVETFAFDHAHPYAAGQHRGIEIAASAGDAVLAPASGAVSFAGTVPGSGRSLTIATPDGLDVTLTHLGTLTAARGAQVSEGDVVAAAGDDGFVHLGVRTAADEQGYLDPLQFLPTPAAPAPPTAGPAVAPAPAPAPAPVSTPAPGVPAPVAPAPVAPAPAAPAPAATAPVAPAPVVTQPVSVPVSTTVPADSSPSVRTAPELPAGLSAAAPSPGLALAASRKATGLVRPPAARLARAPVAPELVRHAHAAAAAGRTETVSAPAHAPAGSSSVRPDPAAPAAARRVPAARGDGRGAEPVATAALSTRPLWLRLAGAGSALAALVVFLGALARIPVVRVATGRAFRRGDLQT